MRRARETSKQWHRAMAREIQSSWTTESDIGQGACAVRRCVVGARVTQRRASETVTEGFSEERASKDEYLCTQPRVAAAFRQRGQQSLRQSMSRSCATKGSINLAKTRET